MVWVPSVGTAQNDLQAIVGASYFDALLAGMDGVDCVLFGCDVTAQGSPNMTAAVTKGAILSNYVLLPVTAGNVTIGTAHATLPRIDLIVADTSGGKQVRAGTAATVPLPPTRTANDVVLRAVYVPAADTTIETLQLLADQRAVRTVGPLVVYKALTAVTKNTTSAIQTYLSLTLPSGLMAAGRIARVYCGGTYVNSTNFLTWTLTLAYGGTTLFADTVTTISGDVDRGAWSLVFDLIAVSLTSQKLNGVLRFQTPGGKTAPAAGVGDLSVTSNQISPFSGSAAVDSDAADRTLTVQVTMSVSAVDRETVMDYGFVELL